MEMDKKVLLLTQTEYDQKHKPVFPFSSRKSFTEKINRAAKNHTFGAIPHYGAGILASEAMSCGYSTDIKGLSDQKSLNRAEEYSIIMVSGMDIGIDGVKDIVHQLNGRHNLVVGGIGPTMAADELRSEFPWLTIVCGEGEGLVQKFIHDFETQSQMAPIYTRENPVNLADCEQEPYMQPKHDFKRLPHFRKAILKPVELSRGCIQGCDFCVTARQLISVKPLEAVKQEILHAKISRYRNILTFVDQNLFSCPQEYLQELFTFINSQGIYWVGEGTIFDSLNNEKLMRIMAQNCLSLLVGIEDFFNPIRGSTTKNYLQQNFTECVKRLRDYRMPILYSIIFGTDDQTPDIFHHTAEMVLKLGITPAVHIVTPRMGTPFFSKIIHEQRLIDTASSHRDHKHVVFTPKKMTPQELLTGFIQFQRETYSYKQIVKRFIQNLHDCGPRYASGLFTLDFVFMNGAINLSNQFSAFLGK